MIVHFLVVLLRNIVIFSSRHTLVAMQALGMRGEKRALYKLSARTRKFAYVLQFKEKLPGTLRLATALCRWKLLLQLNTPSVFSFDDTLSYAQ